MPLLQTLLNRYGPVAPGQKQMMELEQKMALDRMKEGQALDLAKNKAFQEQHLATVGDLNNRQEISGMANDVRMLKDLEQTLLDEGVDPLEAPLLARKQLREIKVNPALAGSNAAKFENLQTSAALPYAGNIGRTRATADISGNLARESQGFTNRLTSAAEATTRPGLIQSDFMRRLAEDRAGIAGAETNEAREKALRPFVPEMTSTGAIAGIKNAETSAKRATFEGGQKLDEDMRKSVFNTNLIDASNPATQAAAQNAEAQASAVRNNMLTEQPALNFSGGLPLYDSTMGPNEIGKVLLPGILNTLTNRRRSSGIVTPPPSSLPSRRPLVNLNEP